MLKGRVFLHSVHASLEHDMAAIFKHLGLTIAKANMDRSFAERPEILGYTGLDYGDEIRGRVDSLNCTKEDFEGCDMAFIMNPSDFHQRVEHFSNFLPTVCYVNGQWVDQQLDELASKINGQWDRREKGSDETPNIWVAVYTKREENYLRPKVHTQLQDRIHHIRFAKKFEDYYPWALPIDRFVALRKADPSIPLKPPEREDWIYTTCNSIHHRGDCCNYQEYKLVTADFKRKLSGRHSEEIGGQGLIAFDQMRQQMRTCAGYLGVPAWPAPLVLNIVEAMMCGAPVAFYDNMRGIAEEGIFDGGMGATSFYVEGLKGFLKRCISDKGFREEQSGKSLERAKEFFDFYKQVEKWRVLFEQMSQLFK